MSFTFNTNTKIETGAAILGATIAAAGAVLIEPVLIVIGAAAVTAATVMRVRDSREQQEKMKESPYSAPFITALTPEKPLPKTTVRR